MAGDEWNFAVLGEACTFVFAGEEERPKGFLELEDR